VGRAENLGFALARNGRMVERTGYLDALRSGGWLLFVMPLLGGVRRASHGDRRCCCFLRRPGSCPPAPPAQTSAPRPALWLAARRFYRRPVLTEQFSVAPWSRPLGDQTLCLGWVAALFFDLYVCRRLLFGRLDATSWAARGFAQALVIPFIALCDRHATRTGPSTSRSRARAVSLTAFLARECTCSRGGAGYYVAISEAAWGKTSGGFHLRRVLLLGCCFPRARCGPG